VVALRRLHGGPRAFSQSNPLAFTGRTFRLNQLLVPPNEGPVAIETSPVTAEQVTNIPEQCKVAIEPAPDRSGFDAFWSSYDPGSGF
jgi:hypothetical protein